jgi:hypothetical protein
MAKRASSTRGVSVGLLLAVVVLSGCGNHNRSGAGARPARDPATLSGRWWNWSILEPRSTNPVADTTGAACARHQPSDVWFLAGTFGGAARRRCRLPRNRPLFFPVVNLFGAAKDCAAFMDKATGVAVLDGHTLALARVNGAEFVLSAPHDNVVEGLDAGRYRTISCGLFASVGALSRGVHRLQIDGTDGHTFHTRVSYQLTVR